MEENKYIISGKRGSGKSTEICRTALAIYRRTRICPVILTPWDYRQYIPLLQMVGANAIETEMILKSIVDIEHAVSNNRYGGYFDGRFSGREEILVDDIDVCLEKFIKRKINCFSFCDGLPWREMERADDDKG